MAVAGNNWTCAIAVRASDGRLLKVGWIQRGPKGDVYVNEERERYDKEFKPHESHHASGQKHGKVFNTIMGKDYCQKPDAHFVGVQNLATLMVAPESPLAIGQEFNSGEYSEVFEIAAYKLSSSRRVSVDLSGPGGSPIIGQGDRIIQRAEYQNAVPWILVTFFEPFSG